jgi:Putative addiction module component
MSRIEEIERTLLALPIEQRAFLAESLLGSLPATGLELSEAEEIEEAERRDREIETGQVQPLSESEFWRKVEANRKR